MQTSFGSSEARLISCSRCHAEGHRAAECPNLPFYRSDPPPQSRKSGVARNAQPARPIRAFECYECGEVGHRKADCPSVKAQRERQSFGAEKVLSEEAQGKLDALLDVYKDLRTGFGISDEEREIVNTAGGSDTYGELLPEATFELLEALDLSPKDVFVDLGCGTGKIVVLAGLCSVVGRAVGLELSDTRVNVARDAIIRAGVQERCAAYAENFLTSPLLDEATICFSCNYTLPEDSVIDLFARFSRLPNLRLVATFKNPFMCLPREDCMVFSDSFRAAGTLNLNCSWAKHVKVFLYRKRK